MKRFLVKKKAQFSSNVFQPEQFEKLKIIVNEELNKSKKKARMKIKELMEEVRIINYCEL